jgi:hypothetical protein
LAGAALPEDWSPHWLRHTHATALLLAGTPPHVVMRRLGHKDIQTTLSTYGWVTEDAEMRTVAQWRNYVARPRPTRIRARRTPGRVTARGPDTPRRSQRSKLNCLAVPHTTETCLQQRTHAQLCRLGGRTTDKTA